MTDRRLAQRIEVHGTVQGVGFRPYVYRLATDLGLDGRVRNVDGHVVIEAAGSAEALAGLADRLRAEAPPFARVRSVSASLLDVDRVPEKGFAVIASESGSAGTRAGEGPGIGGRGNFPPDLSTCPECLAELFDPSDRRFRYPFINCTNCGPRATIIDTLPYDRPRTTMASFPLCEECKAEYEDPADRRFHAEPVACPRCGPRLSWVRRSRAVAYEEDALALAIAVITTGGVVALKGIGGYQLVCDATDEDAVARLRTRKERPAKPFAVMAADATTAGRLAALESDRAVALLESAARPIVLADARPESGLAAGVHPGTGQVGVFLPCAPIHHLLLAAVDRPLVVTSGNRSSEPIAIHDDEAYARLTDLADGFLVHDREIRARYDDSVVRLVAGGFTVVRRARGYAPDPLTLPVVAERPVLATGAQLKHTFALVDGDRVVLSPHIGDLEDHETYLSFEENLAHLSALTGIGPQVVAHDLHPGYLSSQYAKRFEPRQRIAVQHHHAHVASCAAEHGIVEPFIGVAYDGLGLGDDGTLWGGEILVADLESYRRVGRFARAPLPGGEAAVRRPARMALGYLFGGEFAHAIEPDLLAALLDRQGTNRIPADELDTVRRMIDRGVNCPLASSAGRLFDAVSSLLGICDDATYEGEAAVRLESAAGRVEGELPWRLDLCDGLDVFDPNPTLLAVLESRMAGIPVQRIAAAFHGTIVAVTGALCTLAADRTGVRTVCLSGGVFQNRLLVDALSSELERAGFDVHVNELVPVNDGGIAFGQAAVAAARTRTAPIGHRT